MKTRNELHTKLCNILGSDHVYFRAPSFRITYPCILYDIGGDDLSYADNIKYTKMKRWSVTVIDENPDSKIPERLEEIPYCRFDRLYLSDGLNHFVYTIYY